MSLLVETLKNAVQDVTKFVGDNKPNFITGAITLFCSYLLTRHQEHAKYAGSLKIVKKALSWHYHRPTEYRGRQTKFGPTNRMDLDIDLTISNKSGSDRKLTLDSVDVFKRKRLHGKPLFECNMKAISSLVEPKECIVKARMFEDVVIKSIMTTEISANAADSPFKIWKSVRVVLNVSPNRQMTIWCKLSKKGLADRINKLKTEDETVTIPLVIE